VIDVKLVDAVWDLDIVAGDLVLISGHDDVVQHIKQRLLAFRGEWFLDLGEGLPWLTEILGKPVDIALVEALFKERIQGSPGVDELLAFALNPVDEIERALRVDFTVRMVSGESLTLNMELEP